MALVRRLTDDVIDCSDLAALDAIVVDDIVPHAGAFPDGIGPDTARRVLGTVLTGFPEVEQTIKQVSVESAMVWLRAGAHAGRGPASSRATKGPASW